MNKNIVRLTTSCLLMLSISGLQILMSQEIQPRARKFDKFRLGKSEDLKVRCDNFAYYLKEEPRARGYIIFYRNRRRTSNDYHLVAQDYMAYVWKNLPNKIEAVFGGYREQDTMELWIVPEGAEPPKLSPTYVPWQKSKRRAARRRHA